MFYGNAFIRINNNYGWRCLDIIVPMDDVSVALVSAGTGIVNVVYGVELQNRSIGVAFINSKKKNISLVTSKTFVCRLQIWRIRLASPSSYRKEIDDNNFAFIQQIIEDNVISIRIFY